MISHGLVLRGQVIPMDRTISAQSERSQSGLRAGCRRRCPPSGPATTTFRNRPDSQVSQLNAASRGQMDFLVGTGLVLLTLYTYELDH